MPPAKRTKSFSARFSAAVIDELEAHSSRLGESKARVAERLIDLTSMPSRMFSNVTGSRTVKLSG